MASGGGQPGQAEDPHAPLPPGLKLSTIQGGPPLPPPPPVEAWGAALPDSGTAAAFPTTQKVRADGRDGPRGQVFHNLADCTTLMVRNVPPKLQQFQLVQVIERMGFEGRFDFLYIPPDCGKYANLMLPRNRGIAYINFTSLAAAKEFTAAANNQVLQHSTWKKPVEVSAAPLQGFEANVRKHLAKLFDPTARSKPLLLCEVPESLLKEAPQFEGPGSPSTGEGSSPGAAWRPQPQSPQSPASPAPPAAQRAAQQSQSLGQQQQMLKPGKLQKGSAQVPAALLVSAGPWTRTSTPGSTCSEGTTLPRFSFEFGVSSGSGTTSDESAGTARQPRLREPKTMPAPVPVSMVATPPPTAGPPAASTPWAVRMHGEATAFCPQCQLTGLSATASFCVRCGARLARGEKFSM